MTDELSVFEIKGLEDLSQKFVTLVPFTLGEEQSSGSAPVSIGDDLKNYRQQQPRHKFGNRLNNIELMTNTNVDQFSPQTEDNTVTNYNSDDYGGPQNNHDNTVSNYTDDDYAGHPHNQKQTVTNNNLHPGRGKNADMAKHSVLVENSAVPAKKISNHKLGSKIKIDLVSKTNEARSIIKDLPLALATQFKNFLKTLRIEKSGIKIYLKRQNRMKYIILSKINKISLLNFVYILFSSINKIKKNVHEPNLSDMIKFCKQLPIAAKACLGEGISKLI